MVRQAANRDKARSDFNRLRERLRDPLLTVLTIVLAFWMFVLAPLPESAARDTNIVGFLLALAVAGALLLLSGKAVSVLLMLFGISLSAAAAWFRLHDPSPLDILLNASAWIIMGALLIWVVGRAVFAPGRITYHRIMGAILLYLAIGLTFAALFAFVGVFSPDAFSGMAVKDSPTLSSTMIYFSFGTLTTAGSGDIAPIHAFARSLVNLESMIGQLYPATLLARLVTLEIEDETTRG
jgi:Ion channel